LLQRLSSSFSGLRFSMGGERRRGGSGSGGGGGAGGDEDLPTTGNVQLRACTFVRRLAYTLADQKQAETHRIMHEDYDIT